MVGPLPPLRSERTAAARNTLSAPRGSATSPGGSDLSTEQQAQIAAQRQAFDYEAAERAEILREHEVLEALLMAHLKNEDEITKKWISLI
jgi:hypothetical protein